MSVESDADRAAFFDAEDLGVVATYVKTAGGGTEILGLFFNPTIGVTGFEHAGGIDTAPAFVCRSIDIPDGAQGGDAGDTLLTIGADTYRVFSTFALTVRA